MGKRYILVTGGELFNKGAQSMTFVTVDELKKRYPDKEIIVISHSDYYQRDKEYKERYDFEFLPLYGMYELLGEPYRLAYRFLRFFKNKKRTLLYWKT